MEMMAASAIRYTQNSIKSTFQNGDDMEETLTKLRNGVCKVTDIPTIKVYEFDSKWWSLDNRRLWVFKRWEEINGCIKIPIRTVPVSTLRMEDVEKITTKNQGTQVSIRKDNVAEKKEGHNNENVALQAKRRTARVVGSKTRTITVMKRKTASAKKYEPSSSTESQPVCQKDESCNEQRARVLSNVTRSKPMKKRTPRVINTKVLSAKVAKKKVSNKQTFVSSSRSRFMSDSETLNTHMDKTTKVLSQQAKIKTVQKLRLKVRRTTSTNAVVAKKRITNPNISLTGTKLGSNSKRIIGSKTSARHLIIKTNNKPNRPKITLNISHKICAPKLRSALNVLSIKPAAHKLVASGKRLSANVHKKGVSKRNTLEYMANKMRCSKNNTRRIKDTTRLPVSKQGPNKPAQTETRTIIQNHKDQKQRVSTTAIPIKAEMFPRNVPGRSFPPKRMEGLKHSDSTQKRSSAPRSIAEARGAATARKGYPVSNLKASQHTGSALHASPKMFSEHRRENGAQRGSPKQTEEHKRIPSIRGQTRQPVPKHTGGHKPPISVQKRQPVPKHTEGGAKQMSSATVQKTHSTQRFTGGEKHTPTGAVQKRQTVPTHYTPRPQPRSAGAGHHWPVNEKPKSIPPSHGQVPKQFRHSANSKSQEGAKPSNKPGQKSKAGSPSNPVSHGASGQRKRTGSKPTHPKPSSLPKKAGPGRRK